jgi:outer membrane protein OmpA-like peptidoglycan-associated protein
MNKRVILLVFILVALPACQKQTEVVTTKPCVTPQEKKGEANPKVDSKPLFDEDVEGFVLEEPSNAFEPKSEETEEEEISIEKEENEDWVDKRIETTQKYGFKTIYFKYDDDSIRPDQRAALDYDTKKILDLVKKGATVVVEGHACKFGGDGEYNMMLSERRAHNIADYMIEHGVPREKLKIVGRGFEMCIVPEGDMEQQAPNRRVEFDVLNAPSE